MRKKRNYFFFEFFKVLLQRTQLFQGIPLALLGLLGTVSVFPDALALPAVAILVAVVDALLLHLLDLLEVVVGVGGLGGEGGGFAAGNEDDLVEEGGFELDEGADHDHDLEVLLEGGALLGGSHGLLDELLLVEAVLGVFEVEDLDPFDELVLVEVLEHFHIPQVLKLERGNLPFGRWTPGSSG